jgi:hypothetical protein
LSSEEVAVLPARAHEVYGQVVYTRVCHTGSYLHLAPVFSVRARCLLPIGYFNHRDFIVITIQRR